MKPSYTIPLICMFIIIAGVFIVLAGNGGLPSTVGPEENHSFFWGDTFPDRKQWVIISPIWPEHEPNEHVLMDKGWEPFAVENGRIYLKKRIK